MKVIVVCFWCASIFFAHTGMEAFAYDWSHGTFGWQVFAVVDALLWAFFAVLSFSLGLEQLRKSRGIVVNNHRRIIREKPAHIAADLGPVVPGLGAAVESLPIAKGPPGRSRRTALLHARDTP